MDNEETCISRWPAKLAVWDLWTMKRLAYQGDLPSWQSEIYGQWIAHIKANGPTPRSIPTPGSKEISFFAFLATQEGQRGVTSLVLLGQYGPMPLPYGDMTGCSQSEVALRRFDVFSIPQCWWWIGCISDLLHGAPADFQLREPLTGEQRGVITRLWRLATAWRQCGPVTAADMGRSAGKVEKLEVMLTTLTSAAALLVDQGSGKNKTAAYKVPTSDNMGQETVAKDIEADRLKFTGRPTFRSWRLVDRAGQDLVPTAFAVLSPSWGEFWKLLLLCKSKVIGLKSWNSSVL